MPRHLRENGGVTSLTGQFLVAGPDLFDPNFRRTVVLITEHTDEGSMGLVLNRPAGVLVSEAAPELETLLGEDAELFLGGPVQPHAIVVLAEFDEPERSAGLVTGDLGFLRAESGAEMESVVTAIRRRRVFAGYSGWGPRQLDDELARDDWIVVPAARDDVFTSDPDRLWGAVLRRQGGRVALASTMPDDPSVN